MTPDRATAAGPGDPLAGWWRYLHVPEPFAEVPTLRSWLRDWTELDLAGFVLGVTLGVFPVGTEYRAVQGPLFKANALGAHLIAMIGTLVEQGILETRDDGYEVRWRPGEDSGYPGAAVVGCSLPMPQTAATPGSSSQDQAVSRPQDVDQR